MTIILRMAWRNLWRHKRRTWLTVGAMIFSNLILIFSISLQLGSYQTVSYTHLTLPTTIKPCWSRGGRGV